MQPEIRGWSCGRKGDRYLFSALPDQPLRLLVPPILDDQLDAGSLDRLKIGSVAGDQGPLQAHSDSSDQAIRE